MYLNRLRQILIDYYNKCMLSVPSYEEGYEGSFQNQTLSLDFQSSKVLPLNPSALHKNRMVLSNTLYLTVFTVFQPIILGNFCRIILLLLHGRILYKNEYDLHGTQPLQKGQKNK